MSNLLEKMPNHCDADIFTVCTTCYRIGFLIKGHGFKIGDKRHSYECSCSRYSDYIVVSPGVAQLVLHKREDIEELIVDREVE